MKTRSLGIFLSLLLLNTVPAADLTQLVADAAKYESGGPVEPLREFERLVRESGGNAAQRAEVEAALAKLLAPKSTFEARRFACVQLANIGTEASLPAIEALLKDPATTGIACLALGSNPSPKVNDLLRAALGSVSAMARVQLLVTLGDRADTAAVKSLVEFTRSADPATVDAAIGSLGKIASAEALAELATLRQRGDLEQAHLAAKASLVAADKVVQRGDRAAAVGIYEQLLAAAQPAQIRRAALEALLRLDDDGGEKRALEALRGTNVVLKPSAIARLRALKAADASEKFAKEMAKLTSSEQVLLLESLAARNDAAARAAIADKVSAEDAAVRKAAVVALAGVGDAASVPVLAKALNAATNVDEQQTIEMALASLKGGDDVDKQIAALLQTASVPKPGLINVLSRRGNSVVVPALLVEADSTDAATAKAAFRALAKLVTPESLPVFAEKLAKLKAPEAQSVAEAAVAQAVAKLPEAALRSEIILGVLKDRAKTVEGRCVIIGLLPVCGDAKALAAVKSARADQEPRIHDAAVRALADWPDASATDTLLEVAQTAATDTERVVALRGCVRLLGTPGDYSAQEVAARFQKAMGLAKNTDEKKLLLGGLASVHDPIAMKLVEPYLSDATVQAEAAQAAVTLAPHLCGASRDATKSALQKVADLPVDKRLKQTASDLVDVINRFADFITAWQVTGPFLQQGVEGSALFHMPFPPEQADAKDVKWQFMPAGTSKERPWLLDLGKLYGGNHRVAYARAWIHSESEQPARLEVGSDDGVEAWFNGQVVISANRGGDVAPGAQKANVTLKPGSNLVLLKVVQWTAGWGFCGRVARPDGSTLQGIRVEANPPK
ncbi:MAG: HEAT repeat domain-containing protein [Verrucomicrobia bacterium]|nr:HEAT repeat domain-containing protein [Verrucomicrobiota bacterium]